MMTFRKSFGAVWSNIYRQEKWQVTWRQMDSRYEVWKTLAVESYEKTLPATVFVIGKKRKECGGIWEI